MLVENIIVNAIARMDVAILAFIVMFVTHILVMVVQFMVRRPVMALPIFESIMRSFTISLIDRLNKAERSHFALMIRGLIVYFIILVCVTLLTKCIGVGMNMMGQGGLSDIVTVGLFLSPFLVLFPVLNVSSDDEVQKGSYLLLSQSLNRNLVHQDHHGIRRSAIEACVLTMTNSIVAPITMYICGGIPLFILYTSLSLFIRFSQRNNGGFVAPLLWLYLTLRFIPMVMTSIFIVIASGFTVGGRPVNAIRGFTKANMFDLDICVMAYAQNIILGGPYQNQNGQKIKRSWYGPESATAKITYDHVIRAVMHYGVMLLLCVALLLV